MFLFECALFIYFVHFYFFSLHYYFPFLFLFFPRFLEFVDVEKKLLFINRRKPVLETLRVRIFKKINKFSYLSKRKCSKEIKVLGMELAAEKTGEFSS